MKSTAKWMIGGLILAVLAPIAIIGGLALSVLTLFSSDPEEIQRYCESQLGYSPMTPSGNVGDFNSVDQKRNIGLVIEIGVERGISERGITLALMVAMQESRVRNLAYGQGDLDSIGIYQQRPSQGWGTPDQLHDPVYAINAFYDALIAVTGWETMRYLDAALEVQRPSRDAYLSSENYFPSWEPVATRMLQGSFPSSGTISAGFDTEAAAECERYLAITSASQSQLELAVQTYLSWTGDEYRWTDETNGTYPGAGPIASAFLQAGTSLPSSVSSLSQFSGSNLGSVESRWIPWSDIDSGKEAVTRGDIMVWGDGKKSSQADANRFALALGTGLDLRIATYNVLGSSHTKSAGQTPGTLRIERAAKLIVDESFSVVGLQELQFDQREKLMRMLGSTWKIYPEVPSYDRRGLSSVNSIIWDTKLVAQVGEGQSLRMPYYFKKVRYRIPLLRFEHLTSGQEFMVFNTHDPAYRENAKKRFLNAKEHATDADELTLQGVPIFVTGDFNSGFAMRRGGNSTYLNKRENLTYCIMTRSGRMLNAFDASRTPIRYGECPKKTSREMQTGGDPIDHIYVSRGVSVTDYQMIRDHARTGSDHPVISIDIRTSNTLPTERNEHGLYVGPQQSNGVITVQAISSDDQPSGVMRLRLSNNDIQLSADGKWMFPLAKGAYTLTGRYGLRTHPVTRVPDFHNGDDYGAPSGTVIRAMHDGVVKDIASQSAWGNYLRIQYTSEVGSCYAHLTGYKPGLREGDTVRVGDVVGYVGSSGLSTGSHLHLTICTSDEWLIGNAVGTIDPQKLFDQVGIDQ